MSDTETIVDIDGIAAEWAVRESEGGLSEREHRELETWLAQDPRHQGAYVRARVAWCDLDRVAALVRGAPSDVQRETSPHAASLRKRPWMAVAASLLLAVSTGAGFLHHQLSGRYVAGVGEVVRIALDDGSTVMLNSDSVIRVRYGEDFRHVELRRGEATFQVAKDIGRPFAVEAGAVVARAVGTQFAVRRNGDAVSVTVMEGVVEVRRPDATRLETRKLMTRNDRVMVATARPMREKRLSTKEVSRQLSWREGYLVFDGERLADAAAEMNRYSSVPIRIEDPALASEQFVGVFRIGDVRAFARSATLAFDATLREESDALVLARDPRSQEQ